MNDEGFRDDIARLEERIETLTGEIARCRKISLAARILIAAGAVWIVLMLAAVAPFIPTTFFAAMTALLGGIVLLGSNTTTWTQTEAALESAETKRAQLIERMDLRVVGGAERVLH